MQAALAKSKNKSYKVLKAENHLAQLSPSEVPVGHIAVPGGAKLPHLARLPSPECGVGHSNVPGDFQLGNRKQNKIIRFAGYVTE